MPEKEGVDVERVHGMRYGENKIMKCLYKPIDDHFDVTGSLTQHVVGANTCSTSKS